MLNLLPSSWIPHHPTSGPEALYVSRLKSVRTKLHSYRPSKAQRQTRVRRRSSRRSQYFTSQDYKEVRKLIRKGLSPEQITGHLKAEGKRCFCYETIYQYIWRDKRNGGTLLKHLRCTQKRRRKRYSSYDSRGRVANKRI